MSCTAAAHGDLALGCFRKGAGIYRPVALEESHLAVFFIPAFREYGTPAVRKGRLVFSFRSRLHGYPRCFARAAAGKTYCQDIL